MLPQEGDAMKKNLSGGVLFSAATQTEHRELLPTPADKEGASLFELNSMTGGDSLEIL